MWELTKGRRGTCNVPRERRAIDPDPDVCSGRRKAEIPLEFFRFSHRSPISTDFAYGFAIVPVNINGRISLCSWPVDLYYRTSQVHGMQLDLPI
jgi:hypothetical protein